MQRERGGHLVVHDGSEAHDADVDVVLLTHHPGVLQRPPAGERVTTATHKHTHAHTDRHQLEPLGSYIHKTHGLGANNKKTDAVCRLQPPISATPAPPFKKPLRTIL